MILLKGRDRFDWEQADRAVRLAADALDRIRERAETRYATESAAYQESPEGLRLCEWLDALRARATNLREDLPEPGNPKAQMAGK